MFKRLFPASPAADQVSLLKEGPSRSRLGPTTSTQLAKHLLWHKQEILLTTGRVQHLARCPMDAQISVKDVSFVGSIGAVNNERSPISILILRNDKTG